jgi:hypothetical protein
VCSCNKCGVKKDLATIVMCSECGDSSFHIACLDPPLDAVPEDDWYCPKCARKPDEIVGAGQKLKESKKSQKKAIANTKTNRPIGMGLYNASKRAEKEYKWVPKQHKGKIRGLEVGMSWSKRIQVRS